MIDDVLNASSPPGSAVGNGIASGLLSFVGQHAQYQYNRKLMELQADLNRQAWQEQNEYNLPSNQMARLKAAGINPNLALGDSGNASGANAVNNVPSMSNGASAMAGVMQAIKGSQLQDAQIRLLDTQSREIESRIPKNQSQTEYYGAQKDLAYSNIERNGYLNNLSESQREDLRKHGEWLDSQTNLAVQELSNAVIRGNILTEQEYQERVKSYFAVEHEQAMINELKSRYNLNSQQANYYYQLATTEVATRADKIRAIAASADNEELKGQLIRDEITAMQDEVLEGLKAGKKMHTEMYRDTDGNVHFEKKINDDYYRASTAFGIVHDCVGMLGQLLNINLGFTQSRFRGFTQSENVNESSYQRKGIDIIENYENGEATGNGYKAIHRAGKKEWYE